MLHITEQFTLTEISASNNNMTKNSLSLSLRFNGHFPGELGLAGAY